MSCTLPDLSYCASFLSRVMQNPGLAHWQSLKGVLHYLQYTKDMGLAHRSFNPKIHHNQVDGWIDTSLITWTNLD